MNVSLPGVETSSNETDSDGTRDTRGPWPFVALCKVEAKRIGRVGIIFALLFTVCAVGQLTFVSYEIRRTTRKNLEEVADRIKAELAFSNDWKLTGYRHADFEAEKYYVLTADGLQIDVGGFVPGLAVHARAVDDSIFDAPKTIITAVREKWRLFGKKLEGGAIVVGILDLDDDLKDLKAADQTLVTEARKFGSSIAQAIKLNPRDVDVRIHFAVITDSGELKFATGGVPLRILDGAIVDGSMGASPIRVGFESYLLHRAPIVSKSGKVVGQVVVPREVTAELRAVRSLAVFDAAVAVFCWLAVLLFFTLHIAASEIAKNTCNISLEEALRLGEGQTIEFKEGIGIKNLPPEVSAFANTNAGNIFIGVTDNREVCGVPVLTPQDEEKLNQTVREVVQNRIDPLIIPQIKYFDHGGKKVLRLTIPLGDRRPYLVDGVAYRRVLSSRVPAKSDDIRKMH